MAQLTAVFSKPPLDSPGLGRVLDNVLSLEELLKEQETHFAQLTEMLGGLDDKLHQVKDKLPDKPPCRVPPQRKGVGHHPN